MNIVCAISLATAECSRMISAAVVPALVAMAITPSAKHRHVPFIKIHGRHDLVKGPCSAYLDRPSVAIDSVVAADDRLSIRFDFRLVAK